MINVTLESGEIARCRVIERMGFNHDVGACAVWVEHDGRQFMAVGGHGVWRKWMAKDQVQ
jgi:hypothetical protein